MDEDFVFDPSDYGRIGFGLKSVYLGKKGLRDPVQTTLERFRGVMEQPVYDVFPSFQKEAATKIVKSLPSQRLVLLNTDVLVPAALFWAKGDESAEGVLAFIKKARGLKGVNHLDFIRYVRLLGNR